MKWRVVTENVVDLDWDHVEFTPDGTRWLEEWTSGDGYDEEEFLKKLGTTKEWMAFEANWLTEVMLAANSCAAIGDLAGTMYFGFTTNTDPHDQVMVSNDENDFRPTDTDPALHGKHIPADLLVGFVDFTTTETELLTERAESFLEQVEG
jgi:hypothetical protein